MFGRTKQKPSVENEKVIDCCGSDKENLSERSGRMVLRHLRRNRPGYKAQQLMGAVM
jgi:hypothetical protein